MKQLDFCAILFRKRQHCSKPCHSCGLCQNLFTKPQVLGAELSSLKPHMPKVVPISHVSALKPQPTPAAIKFGEGDDLKASQTISVELLFRRFRTRDQLTFFFFLLKMRKKDSSSKQPSLTNAQQRRKASKHAESRMKQRDEMRPCYPEIQMRPCYPESWRKLASFVHNFIFHLLAICEDNYTSLYKQQLHHFNLMPLLHASVTCKTKQANLKPLL